MATASPSRPKPPWRFENGAEWLDAQSGVPLDRIPFDPLIDAPMADAFA